MNKLRMVIIFAALAGISTADVLVDYDFRSGQTNQLDPSDTLVGVQASTLSVTGTISQTSGLTPAEPSFTGSGEAGRILLKAADMDDAVFNGARHGFEFTLSPTDSGEYLQITNIVVDLYSVAGGTWRTAVFVDTGSGMASVNSNAITFTSTSDMINYNESLPIISTQGGVVSFLVDFANANPEGANYGVYIDSISVEGVVTTIPEPASLLLVLGSSAGLIVFRRFRI